MMSAQIRKEIGDLEKQKKKAQNKGDLAEAARLCNSGGELLSSVGLYEQAVKWHEEELYYSEATSDDIGMAIANRKIGECFCELGQYKKALYHQNKHLEVSKVSKNLVEEQRAWATIGRTLFVQSDSCDENSEREECLLKSQRAYLKSLSVCDKLRDLVTEKEILEMRARLYLNLGLVYEWRNDLDEAERFIKKALIPSREQKLQDNIYRCYFSLSGVTAKNKKFTDALDCAKRAQHIGKEKGNKVMEADALAQMGQIMLKLGEFSAAIQMFRKSYKMSPPASDDDKEVLISALKLAVKGANLEHNMEDGLNSSEEKLQIYEKLGDLYSDAKSPPKALEYYKKQLEVAEALGKDRRTLASIYVSLAVTHSENGEPDKAVECYYKEMEIRQGDFKEQCPTWCAIAKLQEDTGKGIEIVKATYMKALECAQRANKPGYQIRVCKDLADSFDKVGRNEEAKNLRTKARNLISEYGDVASDDDSSQDSKKDDDEQEGETEEDIIQLLLAPDSSDEEEEKDNDVLSNSKRRSVSRRYSKRKVDKLNERGETPLHVVCINGDKRKANDLLKKGASVHIRDFCGWQPLHEACNFGHPDIIQLLLDYGANVNDAGGEHCRGVTPLHDAAQNGHVEAVQILISRGADPNLKDEKGNTPLQLVQAAIKADEEELSGSDMLHGRKNVEQFLKSVLHGQRPIHREPLRKRNVNPSDMDTEAFEQNVRSSRNTQKGSVCGKRNNSLTADQENFISEPSILGSSQTSRASRTPHALLDSNGLSKEQSDLFTINSSEDSSNSKGSDPDVFTPDIEMDSDQDSTYASMDEGSVQGLSPLGDSPPIVSKNKSAFVCGNTPKTRKKVSFTDLPSSQSTSLSSSALGPIKDISSQQQSHDRTLNFTSSSRAALKTSINLMDDSAFKPIPDPDIPAFVEEQSSDSEEIGPLLLGGFIVDDVGDSRASKRRRTETGHLDFSSSRSAIRRDVNQSASQQRKVRTTAGQSTTNKTGMNHARQQKPAYKRQSRLTETASLTKTKNRPDFIVNRENCNVSRPSVNQQSHDHESPVRGANDDIHTIDHVSRQTQRTLLRIRVRVEDKVFLIPCRDSNERKTVKWMAEEASQRYVSSTGMCPKISLKTKEGALLDPEDLVSEVLLNNEEVIGIVDSWDAGSMIDKYKTTCDTRGIAIRKDLIDIFPQSSELLSAIFNDKNVASDDLLALSRAFAGQKRLTKINLSGNYIGDEGLKHLSSALPYIPNILILILSCTGIGSDGLSYLSNTLSDGPEANFDSRNNQSSCPLSKLEEIDIGFNCLSDTVSCSSALGKLVQKCKSLRTLGLESCEIAGGMFDSHRELPKALKDSTSIRALNIAQNYLGTVGLRNLLRAIPSPYLTELDISSTVHDSGHSIGPVFDELGAFMKKPDSVLSKLTLNGLNGGDGIGTLTEDTDILMKLEHLNLNSSNISRNSALSLARSLPPNLSVMDLSGNSLIDNAFLDCLLKALSKPRNATISLKLSSCSIVSPLPESIFHNLKTCSSLVLLNMNFNDIDSNDKDKFVLGWKSSNKPSRELLLEGEFCLLFDENEQSYEVS